MWIAIAKTMLLIIVVLGVGLSPVFTLRQVSAAPLLSRNVVIGNSLPSVTTTHHFNFTIGTVGTLGSILFEYCSNSPIIGTPCTAPVGMDVSGVSIATQTGETGFSIDPATDANTVLLTRAPGANSAIPVSYRFSGAINPSDTNSTVYVRISTHATADGSGAFTDDGSVAFSTTIDFTVEGYVPPYLIFCVGVTVAGNCSSASGQHINFGELRSTGSSFATSQFAGATNDPGGYSASVSGLTMTSGTNVIPALASPTPSQAGISQFGMNLRANSIPAVGSNPSGVGSAAAVADYNQLNQYVFKNQIVTVSTLPTDFNLFTASYVVNVSPNQAPGIYNTTLTYVAVAAF